MMEAKLQMWLNRPGEPEEGTEGFSDSLEKEVDEQSGAGEGGRKADRLVDKDLEELCEITAVYVKWLAARSEDELVFNRL